MQPNENLDGRLSISGSMFVIITVLFASLAGFTLIFTGCAGLYSKDTFRLPQTVPCNVVTRCIPGDKIYYIPWATGAGLFYTVKHTVHKCDVWYLVPITVVFTLSSGLINTTSDTVLNIVGWIPLEIYEGVTGETWERPYMPFTSALVSKDKLDDILTPNS
jgi:hypothetical protein